MRVLKSTEFNSLEQLMGLTQKELKEAMTNFLKMKYKKVIKHDKYLCAIGDIPIALVAHLDTVFKYPAQDIYYDPRKNVMWCPDGLGADDRAGVYAIINIINGGLRPHIIFTTDEEMGGLGAAELAKQPCPFDNLNYILQLDRRGANDCVFYDCYNPLFIQHIESFGFIEQTGSFSDISILCPAWNICGVNLSIGYQDEHSYSETLHIGWMFDTINKVKSILQQESIPQFKYVQAQRNHLSYLHNFFPRQAEPLSHVKCYRCGYEVEEYDTFMVRTMTGEQKYCCIDCLDDTIEWCSLCQEPFEVDLNNPISLCVDCVEKMNYGED